MKVVITPHTHKTLTTTTTTTTLVVVGFCSCDCTYVVSCCRVSHNSWEDEIDSIHSFLPAGLCVVGVLSSTQNHSKLQSIGSVLETLCSFSVLLGSLQEGNIIWYQYTEKKLSTISIVEQRDIIQETVCLRVTMRLNLPQGENTEVPFLLPESLAFSVRTLENSSFILFPNANKSTELPRISRKNKNDTCLEFSVLPELTGQPKSYLPPTLQQNVRLRTAFLDVFAYLHESGGNMTYERAANVLRHGITKQALVATKLLNSRKESQTVEALHYQPQNCEHLYTILSLPSHHSSPEASLERRKLHCRLFLPEDRPLFHPDINSLSFDNTQDKLSVIKHTVVEVNHPLSVHQHLDLTTKTYGEVALVQGDYEYFHYLHDSFDDKGWGCAYRSMQTLCSWVCLQGYSSNKIPCHREIQEMLVSLGDKESTFVGSRNWIGAIEIGMCFQHLYNIDCKVLHVRSGAEVPSKCGELFSHFNNQGSPVMIGGGVLAYTLVGIDYNEGTEAARFLILDPHFIGKDTSKAITEKKGCAWRGPELFLKDHFYNFCLPQRPNFL